ncbi:MAG: DNA polymerase III subunit delta' [Myxococcota bacterium]
MISWHDIRGQERPLDILQRALDTGRVHHAYLFTGLEGVGKFQTAHTFAAVVNCLERPEGEFRDACGTCSSCRKIAQIQHPDLMVIEPDGTRIKIDQIREVQKASSKAPYEARYRMVLIDQAHTMTEQAANALLKTLEEPATRMRLILVTDQPHMLLDTIISRCQILRFGALDTDDVVDLLGTLTAESDAFEEPVEPHLLEVAAGYGEGSVGRSFAVLESGMLGARKAVIESVTSLPNRRPVPLLDLAEELNSSRDEFLRKLDVLKLFFRDVMMFQATGSTERLVNRDLQQHVETFASDVSRRAVLGLLDEIRTAQHKLDRNVNGQLIAENLLERFRNARQAR